MKRFLAVLTALTTVLSVLPVQSFAEETRSGSSDTLIVKKFDLGGMGAADGYIGVSADEKYDHSKGYGFANTSAVENVKASGKGALSDAVRFKHDVANHIFNVDLPSGVYRITVAAGDVESTTISAEGVSQILFMTGSNASDSFTIPVTDGQLNIYAGSGVGGVYSISSVEIEQISEDTETKPTIWISGDSTVASYYNVSDDAARGWGQYLKNYVDTDKYEVRNISISGISAADVLRSCYPTVDKYGKSGDIYLLSVGINDYIQEYKKNPDSIDPSEYIANMTKLINLSKEKGMTVYLVKQQGEMSDWKNYPILKKKWFSEELEVLAESEDVKILDLFTPWLEFCLEKTYKIIEKYYYNNLHPNALGADKLAWMAAKQLFPDPVQPDNENNEDDKTFDSKSTVVYQTEESGGPVVNPHKGYVMNVYSPRLFESGNPLGIGGSKDNHAWDVISVCSGVLFWKDLNPEEGKYDWSQIDEMLEACEKRGMTYGIRVLPYSTGSGSDDNYGAEHSFVPQWVYDKGARQDIATYKYDKPDVQIKIPHWSDEIYIKAYKDFISAMAERYDGDPRVEYVELRAFGNFGEWHTSQFVGNDMPSEEIQKDMIAHFASVFKNTAVCAMSDVKGDVYDFARSVGIAKRNNGLIMTPNEEWDLIPAYRDNLPTMGDFHNSYEYMLNADGSNGYLKWTPEHYRECIEIAHLSLFSIDMDSTFGYQIYLDQKDLINEMVNKLGYNFTVTSAKRNGNKLQVRIKNTGLAPAFFNIDLCAEICDAEGNKIAGFGTPVRIEKGSFHDDTEKTFVFEYDGSLSEDAVICLAMYESDNKLVQGRAPTVKFDNINTLSNNRLKLSASKSGYSHNIIIGDLNHDSTADLTDLTCLSLYLMNAMKFDDDQISAADVDENGEVDIADLAYFKQYVSKDTVVMKKLRIGMEKSL